MNETEARAQNVAYRLARLPMAMVLRTRTLSQTRGFVKALIGTDDRILRLHSIRRRSERNDGSRADGDARRHAVYRAA